MSDLDDIKAAANPYTQLTKATNEAINQNEIKIKLLSRLCDLKETQQANDKKFRDAWQAAKIKDTRMGMGILAIAGVALYLDYFRGWPVIKYLTGLVGRVYGYFI